MTRFSPVCLIVIRLSLPLHGYPYVSNSLQRFKRHTWHTVSHEEYYESCWCCVAVMVRDRGIVILNWLLYLPGCSLTCNCITCREAPPPGSGHTPCPGNWQLLKRPTWHGECRIQLYSANSQYPVPGGSGKPRCHETSTWTQRCIGIARGLEEPTSWGAILGTCRE